MKPILRWTAGSISVLGANVLVLAIQNMRKLYPELDLVVCHNNLSEQVLSIIQKTGVDLHQQTHCSELEYVPDRACWKFYPPRLRFDAHEIVMDNDIILMRRCPEIDQFLESNSVLLYEGIYGCHGKYKVSDYRINSGIFGFPPQFDFAEKIRILQKNDPVRAWENWFDDQGIVGATLTPFDKFIIPQKSIPCIGPEEFHRFNKNLIGAHFTYANRLEEHKVFNTYFKSYLWTTL